MKESIEGLGEYKGLIDVEVSPDYGALGFLALLGSLAAGLRERRTVETRYGRRSSWLASRDPAVG